MSATLAPQGVVPARHPSGTIRIENRVDGILSTYGTNLFHGTPVKFASDGTLQACAAGADVAIGVFQGCEYSSGGKRFVTPNWPAGQTYDAGTMIAKFTMDPAIIYSAQAKGPLAAAIQNDSLNLGDASQGSTFTGYSTQGLAVASQAAAGLFKVVGIDPAPDNAWGDAFTRVLVVINTYQPAAA